MYEISIWKLLLTILGGIGTSLVLQSLQVMEGTDTEQLCPSQQSKQGAAETEEYRCIQTASIGVERYPLGETAARDQKEDYQSVQLQRRSCCYFSMVWKAEKLFLCHLRAQVSGL